MVPPSWYVAGAASVGLFIMTGLYLELRDELASEVEQCNTDKIAAVAEAERVTRKMLEQAHQARMDQLARQTAAAERAREIAEEAARLAESRPPRVVEVIRESTDACLDTVVDPAVVRSLRGD